MPLRALSLLCGIFAARVSVAQSGAAASDSLVRRASLVPIGGIVDDRLRQDQVLGAASASGYMLRSLSSSWARAANPASPSRFRITPLFPDVSVIHNSKHPFSINDGGLWAGRGLNAIVVGGLAVERDRVRLVLAPEFTYSANEEYPLSDPKGTSPRPSNRSPFSSPWHAGPQSIDLPIRFGAEPLRKLRPGQSSLIVGAGPAVVGVSTENEWWGPGARNALLLSNNAPGFPHLLIATAKPIHTRVGAFEGRWISGGLRESPFFIEPDSDALRSVSALGVVWQPKWESGLTVGAARSVFSAAPSWPNALARFLDVFADVGQPNAHPVTDTTFAPGRDQLMSLFFRWLFPADRLELYGEWGRAEFPKSLRDFLEEPNHTQGYVLGVQWLSDRLKWDGRIRLQAEVSLVQQSSTYRFRPIGSWYTSRAVEAGYTNEGQVIGAAVGPGGSSQWLAADYVARTWQLGATVNRIRWMEDAHGYLVYPTDQQVYGYTDHDVSFLFGLRAAKLTELGTASLEFSSGWRMNPFFRWAGHRVPDIPPPNDVRNRTISLRFSPRWH